MISSREFEIYTAPEYQRVQPSISIAKLLVDGIRNDSKCLIQEYFTERNIYEAIDYYGLYNEVGQAGSAKIFAEVRKDLTAHGYKEITEEQYQAILDAINKIVPLA